jgi:hypothetical protein
MSRIPMSRTDAVPPIYCSPTGYIVMTANGSWMRAGDQPSLAVAGHQTMRAALYALLVECTTNRERKAA